MGETPCSLAASLDSFVPPRIGGLGGQNHTHNQQRRNFRLQEGRTPFNDISAISFTGDLSLSGLLEINGKLNSNQDPGNLPISLVNPSQLIVANCPSSGKVALSEPNKIEKVASTPTSEVSYLPMRGKRRSVETPTASRPKKIVEAQGWTVDEDGTIILTAEPNTVIPKSNWYIPKYCIDTD
ncbi:MULTISPECIES: hypothetical protein [unclassified Moorena]|uniref:hypothetical protein n=1 Tax=unclassified Moorena TaxID=2683338 RepID=UPI0013FFEFE1|nr:MULTISPECIES: hypothetical protein [unclassified Moorena]NEO11655.1 hypothetical protein [Moorena sp. SIO3E8]NEQ01196.1 hypothetical protein [Moorena sp. SIO3F7]